MLNPNNGSDYHCPHFFTNDFNPKNGVILCIIIGIVHKFVDAIRAQSLSGKEGEIIFLAVNCNCDKLKGFQILIYHNWELETPRESGMVQWTIN